MSFLGAVQFLGFAITPGIGSLLAYLPTFVVFGLPFDKYTYPGWFLAITNFAVLLALLFIFQNPPPNEAKVVVVSVNKDGTQPNKPSTRTWEMIKIFGVFLMLNLLVRLVLGILETLGTPMCILWYITSCRYTKTA